MRFYFSKQGECVTTNDVRCQFPFKYNGTEYNSCTTVDNPNNDPWCAISLKGNGNSDKVEKCNMKKCRQTGNLDI